MRCNEQSHSCCIPVLDLQKHNNPKELKLENLSVIMSHHDLEQLSGSLSSYSDLEKLVLVAVICND